MKKLFTKLCAIIVCVMVCVLPIAGCSLFGSSNSGGGTTNTTSGFINKYNTVIKYMCDNGYVNMYESLEEEYCYSSEIEDRTFMITYSPESDQLQLVLTDSYYYNYSYFGLMIRPTSNGLYFWGETSDEGNMTGYIEAKTFKINDPSCMKPFDFTSSFYDEYEYEYKYEYETMLEFSHSDLVVMLKGFNQFLSNVNLSVRDFGFINFSG